MQETKGIDAYLDLSPRLGFAYDVFGTGKTSVKANVGRYLHPASNDGRYVFANPAQNIVTLAARPWTDSNGNWVVDCDLLNAAIQDNRGTGGDLCGQGDANYGKNRAATTMDPSILGGWKARPYDWQFGVSVQQELLPRVSAEVGYYRRWWPMYDGVDITDNLAVDPSAFGQFSVVAPVDPRLPNGGGYTVSGLYNITPATGPAASNVRHGEQLRRLHALPTASTLVHGAAGDRAEHPGRHQLVVLWRMSATFAEAPEGMARRPAAVSEVPRVCSIRAGGWSRSTTYKANANYLAEGRRAGERHVQQPSWRDSSRGHPTRPTIRRSWRLWAVRCRRANVTVPLIAPCGRMATVSPGRHAHRQVLRFRERARTSASTSSTCSTPTTTWRTRRCSARRGRADVGALPRIFRLSRHRR
jgi:hypothetical protein